MATAPTPPRRANTEESWKATEAQREAAKRGGLSLDPEKAKEVIVWPPDAPNPIFAITQKDRPPLVMTAPEIPCACGSHLAPKTVTSELLLEVTVEGYVAGVKYRGLCYRCGWQTAIFPIAHHNPTQEEIDAVHEVMEMRRSA